MQTRCNFDLMTEAASYSTMAVGAEIIKLKACHFTNTYSSLNTHHSKMQKCHEMILKVICSNDK